MGRLAGRYWDQLPWTLLERDNHFRLLAAELVKVETLQGLEHLDDQAIVVLFSVFESLVRHKVLEELDREGRAISHRALRVALDEAWQRVEEGSFFQVLQFFKEEHADLVEQVNQVRRYRNRVAHGKRGAAPSRVLPRVAYERLNAFLTKLDL